MQRIFTTNSPTDNTLLATTNSQVKRCVSSKTTDDIFTRRALDVASDAVRAGRDDAFLVVDLQVVAEQLKRWQDNLPRVKPCYAVKCHPDEEIMRVLYAGGAGFDAASPAEIDAALSVGSSPLEIIYANPCKQPSHIRHADSRGVSLMTFDNVSELRKIKKNHSCPRLMVRILADDSSSVCKFNLKFGVAVHELPELMLEARSLGLDIVGVSFHVGSGCLNSDAFVGAVERARAAFDLLHRFGFAPHILDLGGGWPGSLRGQEECGEIIFEDICDVLRPALDALFPPESGVTIIGEPGRYFAHACGTAAVNITSKRKIVDTLKLETQSYSSGDDTDCSDESVFQSVTIRYYVNDGVYATFNNVLCDHRDHLEPRFVLDGETGACVDFEGLETITSSVWGNTCDGIDAINKAAVLPECEVGQWFIFADMGAYTSAASSKFNGFSPAEKIYIR